MQSDIFYPHKKELNLTNMNMPLQLYSMIMDVMDCLWAILPIKLFEPTMLQQ